jgi:DNA-binding response OmpR family regulator/HPt (histidine-containing phosphotransfer) domain-containing protein
MKILIIEDDRPTSDLLSTTLTSHRYAVDTVSDGAAGLDLASHWDYDLILLDILLPKLNGIEVCRRLRDQRCQTPILMLTMKDANEDVIMGLDAGADDYLAKSCATSQLLARVRALLRRGGKATAPVLSWGQLCLDPASAQVTYANQVIALRPKEYSLLELFLRNPQRIFSRSDIIDHLWSLEETPVEGSITNLIKDLRQRLKSAGLTTDLIETVYGVGYRLKAAPETGEVAEQAVAVTSYPPLAHDPALQSDWSLASASGVAAIEEISHRFQVSLEQRLAVLEAAVQALQAGNLSRSQLEAVQTQAHKLAGGLGTFGYLQASAIAQEMEHLIEQEPSHEPRFTQQFARLLQELKQALALPVALDCYCDAAP